MNGNVIDNDILFFIKYADENKYDGYKFDSIKYITKTKLRSKHGNSSINLFDHLSQQ